MHRFLTLKKVAHIIATENELLKLYTVPLNLCHLVYIFGRKRDCAALEQIQDFRQEAIV
jgi:hypothetical protein